MLPIILGSSEDKKSSEEIFQNFMPDHIDKGIEIIKYARHMQAKKVKGAYHRNIGM